MKRKFLKNLQLFEAIVKQTNYRINSNDSTDSQKVCGISINYFI